MPQRLPQPALLDAALAGEPALEKDPTTNRILDAALAEFLDFGLRRATVEDITRRAGVGRMTVHRRFASKQSLVEAVWLREIRRVLDEVNGVIARHDTLVEKLVEGLAYGLRGVAEHPLFTRLLRDRPRGDVAVSDRGRRRADGRLHGVRRPADPGGRDGTPRPDGGLCGGGDPPRLPLDPADAARPLRLHRRRASCARSCARRSRRWLRGADRTPVSTHHGAESVAAACSPVAVAAERCGAREVLAGELDGPVPLRAAGPELPEARVVADRAVLLAPAVYLGELDGVGGSRHEPVGGFQGGRDHRLVVIVVVLLAPRLGQRQGEQALALRRAPRAPSGDRRRSRPGRGARPGGSSCTSRRYRGPSTARRSRSAAGRAARRSGSCAANRRDRGGRPRRAERGGRRWIRRPTPCAPRLIRSR